MSSSVPQDTQSPQPIAASDASAELARALTDQQRLDEALDCWRNIERIHPDQDEPSQQVAALIIARNRQRTGFVSAGELARGESQVQGPRSKVAERTSQDTR